MINRKQLKKIIETEVMKSGFIRWLEKEVIGTNLNLSDQYCQFHINPNYAIKGVMIIIEAVCTPKAGVFQGIEFRPKIFINSCNIIERPKIYNNRRIFHPNINTLTCEIISKELVLDWNPTVQFSAILHHLKYLIIEPNCKFVPNNDYNRKAAWNYHFNKVNYGSLIIENCPMHLDRVIGDKMTGHIDRKMDIENGESEEESVEEYWSIDNVIVKQTVPSVLDTFAQDLEEEENIDLLAKKIKTLHFSALVDIDSE